MDRQANRKHVCRPSNCRVPGARLTGYTRSDADSDVLAEYVIALLRHDGDPAAVRTLCEQEIPDFLTEGMSGSAAAAARRITNTLVEPKAFLDDVFQAITYRSYLPGAPPPPKHAQALQPQAPSFEPAPGLAGPLAGFPPFSSKKRAFDDGDEFGANQGRGDPSYRGRATKQPRRGGRQDDARGDRHMTNGFFPPPGMPQFDPNNPMEAFLQMQAMGFPLPTGFHGGKNQRRRKRCRDFDKKGFCSRGSTCQYDHGHEPIYVPGMAPPSEGKLCHCRPVLESVTGGHNN